MGDIVGELRTMSERGVFTSADKTAKVSPTLFRLAADEIERLQAENEALRAENESWRSLDQIRLGLLRQSAAEVQRLQALIDAYVTADRKLFHFDLRVGIAEVYAEREQALAALLDAATKEDNREA